MYSLLRFAAFALLTNVGFIQAEYLSTLRLASVVFRHGEIAPTHTYPTDVHGEEAWWQGWGYLTKLGIKDNFVLGRYFREYFKDFINTTYDNDEIYVRSTDKARALVSAYSTMAGLYWTSGCEERVCETFVPVHAPLKAHLDAMLSSSAFCPRFSKLLKDARKGEEYQQFEKDHKEFLDYTKNMSGIPASATLFDVNQLMTNAVMLEKEYNMTLPDWITDKVALQLYELKQLKKKFDVYTEEMIAIRSGIFFKDLISHTKYYISGKLDPKMKIFFYSVHAKVMIVFLAALGIWDEKIPPFSAPLMFELHEREPGEFYIRVLYRKERAPDADPEVMKLPGCDVFCPVEKFYEITKPYTWQSTLDDWHKMCVIDTTSGASEITTTGKALIGMTVVAVTLFLILFGVFIIYVYRQLHSRKTYEYL